MGTRQPPAERGEHGPFGGDSGECLGVRKHAHKIDGLLIRGPHSRPIGHWPTAGSIQVASSFSVIRSASPSLTNPASARTMPVQPWSSNLRSRFRRCPAAARCSNPADGF